MQNKRIAKICLSLVFILLTLTLSSLAQTETQTNTEEQTTSEFPKRLRRIITEEEREEALAQEVDSYIKYIPTQKAYSQPGKIGIIDTASEYNYEFKLFDKLPIELTLQHQYISINNSTVVKLPPHLVGIISGVEVTLPFFKFDKTYFRFGINPSFVADGWDLHSKSFRIPFQNLLIYQPNEKWTFVGGLAVFPQYENMFWPVFGFIYKPNDKLSFNIVPKNSGIYYALNDKVTLFGEGDISFDEYAVSKDNRNAVLQYKEVNLGAGVKYKFNKYIESSFSVGGVFNRYLKYRDSLGKVNIKDGVYTQFRLDIKI